MDSHCDFSGILYIFFCSLFFFLVLRALLVVLV